jgi:acyl-homoserine-lactone acylase
MALSFSEGSIGGDIERVNLGQLQALYGKAGSSGTSERRERRILEEPGGSNGAAVAPSNTSAHHALLLINPTRLFFFRSELQVTSDEGAERVRRGDLGTVLCLPGFNEHTGWMHTSSAVGQRGRVLETVTKKGDHYVYKHGADEKPVEERVITLPYKTPAGMAERKVTAYFTAHGPIVRTMNDKWIAWR